MAVDAETGSLIKTQALLDSGQGMLIGGRFRDVEGDGDSGVPLIRAFFEQALANPLVGAGLLAAKYSAVSLLPISGGAGTRILIEMSKAREKGKLASLLMWVELLVGLPLMVCWLIALVGYFAQA